METYAPPEHVRSVAEAACQAVAYADIFDYPLTFDEVARFIPWLSTSCMEVEEAVKTVSDVDSGERPSCHDTGPHSGHDRNRPLSSDGTFVYCRGRAAIVTKRLERARHARQAWRRARAYALALWCLPFVRMVAVTGALAVNNVDPGDDIDFLVITEPGRLWTTRAMILIVSRLARLLGDRLCPNYLVTTDALSLDSRDLYTAHELVHMVPLHGRHAAARLWIENLWCRDFLPNARCAALEDASDRLPAGLQATKYRFEKLLRRPPLDRLETWETRRKVARLEREVPPGVSEALYTADVCKGHDSGHRARIMEELTARVQRLHAKP